MKNKIIIGFVLILLAFSVVAEEEIDYGDYSIYEPDSETYNPGIYQNANSYQNADFYMSSDPSKWNWGHVEWKVIHGSDVISARVYSQDKFYASLPDDEYSNLDYNQVNYDKITDHDKIDEDKYFADLKCVDCLLFREDVGVKFSKGGLIHPKTDAFTRIPGSYPSYTKFVIEIDVIVAHLPDIDNLVVDITHLGEVTLYTQGNDVFLSNGAKVNGRLSFTDGQAFVYGGDDVIVDGVLIINSESLRGVDVYFEEGKYEESYILIDKEAGYVQISSEREQTGYRFLPGNPIFDVEEGDHLAIIPGQEALVGILAREDEGKIPVVDVVGDGVTIIENGKHNYVVDGANKNIDLKFIEDATEGSVAFTLFAENSKGESLIGTDKVKGKIIFDKSNQLVVVDQAFIDDEQSEITRDISATTEKTNFYNIYVGFFSEETGITVINDPDFCPKKESKCVEDPFILTEIYLYQKSLPKDVRESLTSITIYDGSLAEKPIDCDSPAALACAIDDGKGQVVLRADFQKFNLENKRITLYHEASHTLHYKIRRDEGYLVKEVMELKSDISSIALKYGIDPNQDYGTLINEVRAVATPEELRILEERAGQIKYLSMNSFEGKWLRIAGDVYDKDIKELETGLVVWEETNDAGLNPKNGCVRAYGCKNYREDIATFTEPIALGDHDFYKPYIDPSSPDYDPRYRQKLDLLHEYGFISDEDYQKITAGVQ